MKQEITISRKEFQEKAGKSISEGLRKMEACAQDFRKKDADAAMSSMMAGLFHVKECVDAASQMEKELFYPKFTPKYPGDLVRDESMIRQVQKNTTRKRK